MTQRYTENQGHRFALNRSLSFSGSPVSQLLYVEQAFQNRRGETLIRQYSCEQIYDRSNENPTVKHDESIFLQNPNQSKSSCSSTLINSFKYLAPDEENINLNRSPLVNRNSNLFDIDKKCTKQLVLEKSLLYGRNREIETVECTPMEVDTSAEDHPVCNIEDNYVTSLNTEHKSMITKFENVSNVEKNIANRKVEQKEIPQTFTKFLKLSCVFIVPVICTFFLMHTGFYVDNNLSTPDNFKFENITNALRDLLYGQEEVVQQLEKNLNIINNNHLIIFTGGVGVGKTYSANIISNNFPWKDNIIKISFLQYKNSDFKTDTFRSLSETEYNLIIVDNLEIDDKKSVIPFIKKMFNSDKKLIMILIYTIPEISFDSSISVNLISSSNDISDSLSQSEIKHLLIIFKKLDAHVVRKCISYAMFKKGLIPNENKIEQVLKNVNYKYSGCKGVYMKVALLR